jgi:hypothetical protein
MRAAIIVCVLAACGSDNHKPPDAAVDAPIDVPPPPPGHYHYVVDHLMTPRNNNEARMYGMDLDNDALVDNQLGMVMSTLDGMGFTVQTDTDHAIDTGGLITLVDLYAEDFTTTVTPTLTTYDGANPFPFPCNGTGDTTCRHHLAGTAMFTITSTMDPPLAGTITAGALLAGPGQLEVELEFGSATPIKLTLIGARTKFAAATATTITGGVIAGAVSQADINAKLVPGMATGFQALVQRDCCGLATSPGGATCNPTATPACGCVANSTGRNVIGLFDATPKDCMITAGEIQNNVLIQALLAPDVSINGTMGLSMGFGYTGIVGAFAAP